MDAKSLADRAHAHHHAGQEQEALVAAAQALKLDGTLAPMWGLIGFLLLKRGRWDEAEQYLKQSVLLDPSDAKLRAQYAIALAELDRYAEAYSEVKAALTVEPDSADALYLAAEVLCRMGRYAEAKPYYDSMIDKNLLMQSAVFGSGFADFMMGDFDKGIKKLALADPADDDSGLPDWDGKPNPDAHVLLMGQAGFGDIMQYIRYAPLMRGRVASVTLSLPYHLVGVMRDSFPDYPIHAYQVPESARSSLPPNVSEAYPANLTARCGYARLPYLAAQPFNPAADAVPYLRADPAKIAAMAEKLKNVPRPRIGLVWSGNPRNQNNHNRSVPFDALKPLIDIAKPHLVGMQKNDPHNSAAAAGIFDATPFIEDFTDSAALMANLDLVITVCSAPAHLAGAMGIPAFTMLAFNPDWRWLIAREDSIWYPAMRLFRAEKPKGWDDVVGKLCAAAKKLIGGDVSVLRAKSWAGPSPRIHPQALPHI